jgi:hypothetical protein
MAPEKDRKRQAEDDILDWFTISYKTLYTAVAILGLLAAGGGYYYYTRTAPPPTLPPERPAQAATSARFTQLEGSVKVRRIGSLDWVDADKTMVLRKSDLVKTGAGAVAQINFFDDTVVDLRPDSLLTIEETSENPATKERRVSAQISSGAVDFTASARKVKGSETAFSTPTLTATIGDQGARGVVAVDQAGTSAVSVLQGSQVVQTTSGTKVNLAAGTALKVDGAGKVSPVVVLPGVPTLEAPPHQAEISYLDPSRSTTLLAWKAIPAATSYHLMLDYSPRFNRPLVDRTSLKDRSQEIRGLEPGKYFWKVAAVDKDGVEGFFSDTALFTVTRPAAASAAGPPPPLTLETLEVRGNILQVKGRTEPGARITVNGHRVDVREDGSFNEYLSLDKAGKQEVVVRATGINGGVKETRRPVSVGY